MGAVSRDGETQAIGEQGIESAVRRFRLTRAGASPWESQGDRCAIGSHPSNDVVLDDPTVSRFHCEIAIGKDGTRVRDLGSTNGTFVDGLQVIEAYLRPGSRVAVGRQVLELEFVRESNPLPVSARTRFGGLIGESVAMRRAFALLERAAASDATVLLEGETGTGKE